MIYNSKYMNVIAAPRIQAPLPEGYTFVGRSDVDAEEVAALMDRTEWREEGNAANWARFEARRWATVGVRDTTGTLVGLGDIIVDDSALPLEGAQLSNLLVDQQHRGRGIGTAILAERLSLADQSGIKVLLVPFFEETNTIIGRFVEAGFQSDGQGTYGEYVRELPREHLEQV
jgi:GNAT superfamily N-acetyltransferase